VQLQAFWVQDDRLYIAMELAKCTLRDRLGDCKEMGLPGIPAAELLDYFRDAGEALDYLHSENVLHRDIKPANILLFKAQTRRIVIKPGAAQPFKARAKVADFGLARLLETQQNFASFGGTYAYMAPEVYAGHTQAASDLYSLAASYVEMRLGRALFPYNALGPLMEAQLHEQPDLSGLPKAEQDVLQQALAKDPARRFSSCQQFVNALAEAVTETKSFRANWNPPGYQLLRPVVGGSARGQVWEAVAPDGKRVACTVFQNLLYAAVKEQRKSFSPLQGLAHPHLAQLYEVLVLDSKDTLILPDAPGQPDDSARVTLCLISELLPENLGQRLDKCLQETGQGIPVRELLRYMGQAAEAIDYLKGPHQSPTAKRPSAMASLFGLFSSTGGARFKGPVSLQHCAINPRSLLVEGDTLKVSDFGMVCTVPGSTAQGDCGDHGPLRVYGAPELFQKRVSSSSDQYSLAVTYVELRTGRSPFQSSSPSQLAQLQQVGKLHLDRLTEVERAIISKAIALKPEERFPNCRALVGALNESGSVVLKPPSRPAGEDTEKARGSARSQTKTEEPEKRPTVKKSSETQETCDRPEERAPAQPAAVGPPPAKGAVRSVEHAVVDTFPPLPPVSASPSKSEGAKRQGNGVTPISERTVSPYATQRHQPALQARKRSPKKLVQKIVATVVLVGLFMSLTVGAGLLLYWNAIKKPPDKPPRSSPTEASPEKPRPPAKSSRG
jgi:serine/threonine protein kinase